MTPYMPEGFYALPPGEEKLKNALQTGEVLQGLCTKCDEYHDLHIDLGHLRGRIPREEAALEGTNEYAILSRVGKAVSFRVMGFQKGGTVLLSRKAAQEEARDYFLNALRPGDVLGARVQTPAQFGAFCDIGCGFTALMRIDRCCVSRLQTTAQRFSSGQEIFAAVLSADDEAQQIALTGRETLGTWTENAADFRSGQTVTGYVRSIMPYGVFVELTPNLSGLSEPKDGIREGDFVSVHIRSIQEDRHKIKLTILEILPLPPVPPLPKYFVTGGHMETWEYYPGSNTVTYF